jgi:toxin-antitoxin system PIN domain toxin
MRALLDVNVLIALLDADHVSHRSAITWFEQHARNGWASCPITQNGCVRIMSNSAYSNAQPVQKIAERLRAMTADRVHEFWADDQSLLDERCIDTSRIHNPRQLTDVYLLALAVKNGGRLVTFDAAIALDAVRGAKAQSLFKI